MRARAGPLDASVRRAIRAGSPPSPGVIGAVVAEFVAGSGGIQSGLAYRILEAGYQLKIARMFTLFLPTS